MSDGITIISDAAEFVLFGGGNISYRHKNNIEDYVEPFAIAKYPVTNEEFMQFLQSDPEYAEWRYKDALFLRHYRSFSQEQKSRRVAVLYIISDGKTKSGIVIITVKKSVRVVFMIENKFLGRIADLGFPRKVNGFMRQHVERGMSIPIIRRILSVGIIPGYTARP